MELKFIILDFFCLKLGSSNCTFMELKYDKFGECGSDFYSSNCTFMELKFKEGTTTVEETFSSNCTFMELKFLIRREG